ncbi:carbamoyltransferase C-terminal domain-containing protein [Bradyrhizobium sp. AUGA SZCCT0160]|uniref:carbamoyltransferase C-terminal domain-containing protein n=1 Tax=Bradyrhizobium sp. AUGA SZCCT0160 TaxID=2807662 RepID=UPI001BAA2F27|nr:carbamoyltransferase C-terminal domain-containing protein [Bradyrhizobium sp. AUGA SZCCT0160]MBR1189709.1 carbamoyltransferase [Bradyrhizobium sp. AUGA SZCCT0160]
MATRFPCKAPLELNPTTRIGPRHPKLAAGGFRAARWLAAKTFGAAGFHQLGSKFADARIAQVRDKLARGETVYLAGLGAPGTHNSGVALVEVTQAHGPRLILNNEEERFSGNKHTTEYPRASVDAMVAALRGIGRDIADIDAWLTSWDYPTLAGTLARAVLEEIPQSLKLLRTTEAAGFDGRRLDQMTRTPKILAKQMGLSERLPLICLPHHDNHAWFSYAASPFADDGEPVAVAVLDGTGDQGSISLYVVQHGKMRRLYCNDSMFDSLGAFYSVISSTQGGWTWLSSEGRYMGAAAWGDMNRATNPYYARLRNVLHFGEAGEVRLNRAMANWYCDPFDNPYKTALTDILGPALKPEQLWNPDAVLRVEDIHHRPDTKDRLDKAAATQLVFEDAMIHVVDHLLRVTGASRLVLTGGVALNAIGNMRLLEHFNEAWFAGAQQRNARLHLWVPPVPGDPGVTIGAAWLFAHLAGAPRGAPMTHAFYCGLPPSNESIASALGADDIASQRIGDISTADGRDAIADLMAFVVAQSGVIALYQGAAETGPRALGHRSILANPCDHNARERLNERVKYREAIRPLAPMATLEAAHQYFELLPGASDAGYNAYNYMVLTAQSKPGARDKIPAVIHADGTGRIQIVNADDDPLTHAYLKALGRHIGVEISVNTSFNVAGPIAQTPQQAIDTLRRSKGLDAVVLVADNGAVYAAWHGGERDNGRFSSWFAQWKSRR